jgi:hypothetical protein
LSASSFIKTPTTTDHSTNELTQPLICCPEEEVEAASVLLAAIETRTMAMTAMTPPSQGIFSRVYSPAPYAEAEVEEAKVEAQGLLAVDGSLAVPSGNHRAFQEDHPEQRGSLIPTGIPA